AQGHGFEDGEDVLLDGELAKDAGFLGEVAHAQPGPAIHRQGGNVGPVEPDLSLVGRDLAGGHPEAGGLAGPIGTKQADDFPDLDVKIHATDDFSSAVVFDEPLDFQDGHSGPPAWALGVASSQRGCNGFWQTRQEESKAGLRGLDVWRAAAGRRFGYLD